MAINKAKNIQTSFWRKNKVALEDYMESLAFETPESKELFEEVMKLPEKYRVVVHLFYYEDYSVKEIAQILKVSESNIMINIRPVAIDGYIDWYNNGGDSAIRYYIYN